VGKPSATERRVAALLDAWGGELERLGGARARASDVGMLPTVRPRGSGSRPPRSCL